MGARTLNLEESVFLYTGINMKVNENETGIGVSGVNMGSNNTTVNVGEDERNLA